MVKMNEYPERKTRELSEEEKKEIRKRIGEGDEDIYELAKEFSCSSSQIAGIKAWVKHSDSWK
ncbi:MAG: hypothetical protein Q7J54_05355 [Candidatus Woesearchaeota archaeon]|nr:hypothetical protein [Candidatus Woesearchaeota archaeon]